MKSGNSQWVFGKGIESLLTLPLEKKQAIKESIELADSGKQKKGKAARNQERILDYLKNNGRSTCAEITGYIGLGTVRTRVLLPEMKEVEALGKNRYRTYRLR